MDADPTRTTDDAVDSPAPGLQAGRRGRDTGESLSLQLALSALAGLIVTVIWAAVGGGYYWPVWVWFGLSVPAVLRVALMLAHAVATEPECRLAIRGTYAGVAGLVCVVIWMIGGFGYFWPVWALAGLTAALGSNALFLYRDRLPGQGGNVALLQRVDELTRTRSGALDVQAAELRRIERDLHDGAQARLVALSMQLGRAEERLADQPDVAGLVRSARLEAGAAIAELRDLARGIAPPVLADRGLAAAAEGLGRRSPMPVTVRSQLGRRPAPSLETAAYFVVAESLTNVAKHAGGAAARVFLDDDGRRLVVEVSDDGPGGANPAGAGLTGLRHRVEALDGTLRVLTSGTGGTTIRAELPCES